MHLLFSYGTLRLPAVQRALFGREVPTTPDALLGYRLATVRITDPQVIATSGSDEHPILVRAEAGAGADAAQVPGACLHLDDAELAAADAYEVADYARALRPLASGVQAWVYLAASEVAEA